MGRNISSNTGAELQGQALLAAMPVMSFQMLLTSSERIAIRASTDPIVMDFLAVLQDQRLATVNMTLPSVIAALQYLVTKTILTQVRMNAILTGAPI